MRTLFPLLLLLSACTHRPAHVQFAERECAKGTVEFHTFYCHSVEGKKELECDIPVAVCAVVDPKTHVITDVIVAKGQDPFDPDDDEAAAADTKKAKGHRGHD